MTMVRELVSRTCREGGIILTAILHPIPSRPDVITVIVQPICVTSLESTRLRCVPFVHAILRKSLELKFSTLSGFLFSEVEFDVCRWNQLVVPDLFLSPIDS